MEEVKKYPIWKKILDLILGFLSGCIGFIALAYLFMMWQPSYFIKNLIGEPSNAFVDIIALILFVIVFIVYLKILFKLREKHFAERNFIKIGLNIVIVLATIITLIISTTVGSCNFPFEIVPIV